MGWIEDNQTMLTRKERRRIFFSAEFNEQLARWKKNNRKTDKDFYQLMGVSKNLVTKWKQGLTFPQGANLEKMCRIFGVEPSLFTPSEDLDVDFVENMSRERESKHLQLYADRNGLDEGFYNWLIRQPGFIRLFPFHYIRSGSGMERNIVASDGTESFPLQKYEFEDDYGNRMMMVEEDIDFIIQVQEKNRRSMRRLFESEKQRVMEAQTKARIVDYLAEYDLEASEIEKRYYAVNFLQERFREDDRLDVIVKEIAEERGVQPHARLDDDVSPDASYVERLRQKGWSEEEIRDDVFSYEENLRKLNRMKEEKIRRKGGSVDTEEGGKADGKHY